MAAARVRVATGFLLVFLSLLQTRSLIAATFQREHWAAPWVAPTEVQFPYQGLHNSLQELLAVQAAKQQIAVTFFTAAHQPMLLNHIYSMVKYGLARNFIVMVLDAKTLKACLGLRLPCYNASHLLPGSSDPAAGEHKFGSTMWRRLCHLKPALLAEVYKLGSLDVLFSDADVTYVRAIWPSYDRMMQLTKADAAFMNEDGRLNSGNFLLRRSERTTKLLDAWTKPPPGNQYLGDQEWLFSMVGNTFDLCSNAEGCQRAKDAGRAAVLQYPSQYNKTSWTGHCPGRRPWPACAPYTLYMHIICYSGLSAKSRWMTYYDLWHLEQDGLTPLRRPHPYLPCPDPVAWQEGKQVDPGVKIYAKQVYDDADDADVKA